MAAIVEIGKATIIAQRQKLKVCIRDAADETEDMKIVEQFDISAIDTESLKGFRNHHKSYRPEHVLIIYQMMSI